MKGAGGRYYPPAGLRRRRGNTHGGRWRRPRLLSGRRRSARYRKVSVYLRRLFPYPRPAPTSFPVNGVPRLLRAIYAAEFAAEEFNRG